MAALTPVPYRRQQADGYCLPACVQMALAYWGVYRSQDELGSLLGVVDDFGAPASNIVRLRTRQTQVVHSVESTIADLQMWLAEGAPVIVYVQTGPLAYWQGQQTQHAVLVVGIDEQHVYLLDPAKTGSAQSVPVNEFLLAWDEMSFTLSVITRA